MADETMTEQRQPGQDEAVTANDDLTVLDAIDAYFHESETARRSRILKNRKNMAAYNSEADWSHKQKGQSREFLPKTAMAIESFSSFFKKSLVGHGDWFQTVGPIGDPLAPEIIRKLVLCHLETCGPQGEPFATIVSDGTKVGALEALMIFKIHGLLQNQPRYRVERGLELGQVNGQPAPIVSESLGQQNVRSWWLLIDLVRPEDYYPDPTGRGLYEIHRVERDLSDVIEWAEAGVYDIEAVMAIEEDFKRAEDEIRAAQLKGQDESTPPSFRKRVVIDEFYGTILDSKGRVAHRKVMCARANEKYLIRKPRPLSEMFWHGGSPLEAVPLIRVPFSTTHKALADNMVPLNMAQNELFNLMFDGGMAAVWGTRQIRTDCLEDPRQVSDGIPPGMTIQVNSNLPHGEKVMETVTTGQVPQEAMAMFAQTDREFQTAALSNELQLGQLPSKEVKATEIVEATTSRAITIDGLVRDVEKGIERVLRKVWLTLLQHADDLATDDVVAAIGLRAASILARMSPAERFARYATPCKFSVFGMSATLARTQEFQKLAALIGLISTNPLMLQAFLSKYSLDKTLDTVLKQLNINPLNLQADEMEMAQRPQQMEQMQMLASMLGGQKKGEAGKAGALTGTPGGPGMPEQINQQATNPMAALGV